MGRAEIVSWHAESCTLPSEQKSILKRLHSQKKKCFLNISVLSKLSPSNAASLAAFRTKLPSSTHPPFRTHQSLFPLIKNPGDTGPDSPNAKRVLRARSGETTKNNKFFAAEKLGEIPGQNQALTTCHGGGRGKGHFWPPPKGGGENYA